MFRSLLQRNLNESQLFRLRRFWWRIRSIGKQKDLTALAKIYGTDKWGGHFYTPHYQHHFKEFRSRRITLLEIGVGGYAEPRVGGESLRMWKRYFPKGRIVSLDIHDKSALQEPGIRIHHGSQIDPGFLDRVIAESGNPHIIIDDGSHINSHIIFTFQHLFPKLRDGGYYVIEDTQTSYWPEYGGDSQDLHNAPTAMNYFKALADGLNHAEYRIPGYQPSYWDRNIVAMHFYHNLIFIKKGRNNEPSNLNPA